MDTVIYPEFIRCCEHVYKLCTLAVLVPVQNRLNLTPYKEARPVRYDGDLLSFELAVGVSQPAEGQLVLTGHAMVKVDQCVIALHVLIQCLLQVPAMPQLLSGSDISAVNVLCSVLTKLRLSF